MSGEGLLPNDPYFDEDRASYELYGEGGRRTIPAKVSPVERFDVRLFPEFSCCLILPTLRFHQ